MKLPKGWGQLPPGRRSGKEQLELKLRQEGHIVRSLTSSISVLRKDAEAHKTAISVLLDKRNYHEGRVITLRNQLAAYKKLKQQGR